MKNRKDSEALRGLLRHALAATAYRAARALKGAPAGYPDLDAGSGVRSPRAVVAHMANDLRYGLAELRGEEFKPPRLDTWEREQARFFEALRELDDLLATALTLPPGLHDAILQGPIADLLAHIGQLALLRRLAGDPVAGENFMRADIEEGQVGPEQPPPAAPFA